LQGNLEQPDKGITPTVPPHCRQLFLVDYLFRHIVAIGHAIEGITITGGEPFDQYAAVLHLTQRIKAETSLSVMLFTNLTLAEVYDQQQGYAPLLATIDVLVTKPSPDHPTDQHPLPLVLPTIPDKHLHLLTNRYTLAELQAVPDAEVIITRDGDVIISGNTPVQW
jgi:anaerobic ribonucleoside-triphosphate reductase activating protein